MIDTINYDEDDDSLDSDVSIWQQLEEDTKKRKGEHSADVT